LTTLAALAVPSWPHTATPTAAIAPALNNHRRTDCLITTSRRAPLLVSPGDDAKARQECQKKQLLRITRRLILTLSCRHMISAWQRSQPAASRRLIALAAPQGVLAHGEGI
jgi:hypothetical protein